ncbi:MAG: Fmu (Sun) domain protein [Actinomycetia bacterium]|nr:Fmu (Sun) domain protein [Actinomycetes bacterium]
MSSAQPGQVPPGRRTPARSQEAQPAHGSRRSQQAQGTQRTRGPQRGGGQRYRSDLPRRTAYDVLAAVAEREAYANLLLPRLLADRRITGRDAALATELAYGTLRGQGTYDAVLAACSDRPLDRLDPPVLHVLRLGAHQLLATRVGDHAAVATSVDLAKDTAGPRASGYVNAVLRRVATRDLDQWLPIVAPPADADPDGYLAIRHSYPRWIVGGYRDALGASGTGGGRETAELEAALAAGNERPRVTLAVSPGRAGDGGTTRDEVMPEGAEPTRWSPVGFTLSGGNPAGLVARGVATVQDEASQLAAILLSRAETIASAARTGTSHPRPPAWLDMCAGPGGKARMLAGLAGLAGARLIAAEVHPHRARLVALALDAAGAPGTSGAPAGPGAGPATSRPAVIVADGRHAPWRDASFDRVLVDVPCTGLGALRRRPEARWRKSPADLPGLRELQRALLRSALAAVRPGGVVGYVTCSPLLAETSDIVRDVMGEAGDAEILDAPALLPDVPDLRAAADPRFAQFWPHRHGTDAIFVALLRRVA